MKKHSLFKLVAIIIAVAVLLTWIFPLSYFGYYGYVEEAASQVGLFEMFSIGPVIFQHFGLVIFYILAVGGLYGVLYKTEGYRKLLDKVASIFKGKEVIFLISIMVLFAFITSMAGLTTALLFLFPFVISVILLLGYDKATAALTTIGSVAVGLIGTTVSAVNTEVMLSILQIEFNAELITKIVLLVAGLVLLVFNVLLYIKKHQPKKENIEKELLPETNSSKKYSWPIVVILDLILVIMIMASISWELAFDIDVFTKFNEYLMNFKIGDFAIFAKVFSLSQNSAFGHWTLNEYTMLVVLGTGVIGLVYLMKPNDFIKSYFEGVKSALKPAILVALAYAVLVITATHPVLLNICKPLIDLTSGLNPVTMSLAALLNSIFAIEPYYIASATGTLQYAVSVITDTKIYPIIAVIWQAIQGFAVLIAPTSVILLATLSYLEISFWKWIKVSWKLILEILVVLVVVFTILIFI